MARDVWHCLEVDVPGAPNGAVAPGTPFDLALVSLIYLRLVNFVCLSPVGPLLQTNPDRTSLPKSTGEAAKFRRASAAKKVHLPRTDSRRSPYLAWSSTRCSCSNSLFVVSSSPRSPAPAKPLGSR